ncbi:hypothetical protein [Aureimonas glaciei]|uniref:Uncharacterized protein n=1 Tax=Aureimonas glaciei TaxID=1776957 RepID=A0A916YF02_9HYPH|nr:hypothetical protein [Aureimonas glaciei]GGD42502.1 hypothetical protein GCM10011335_51500 [Aureimonas glaciei]
MTFHDHMAGANSVRAFLNGFPRLRTDADFRAGFRAEAEVEIERLISALDLMDGDPDLEPSFNDLWVKGSDECEGSDDEASLGWGIPSEYRSQEALGCHVSSFRIDLEQDAGDEAEQDAGDEGEPDEDREPLLGWTFDGEHSTEVWHHGCEEDEASLGWTGETGAGWSQREGAYSARIEPDRETDAADELHDGEPRL